MQSNNLLEGPLQPTELPINQYIYTDNNFPCLVDKGEAIEDPAKAKTPEEKYAIIARNALRHLTYGTSVYQSHLLTWDNFKSLFIKRNPLLFTALRKELSRMFYNAFKHLNSKSLDEQAEARLTIFIKNILAAYPYLDPEQNEELWLPQKINNEWQYIKFNFDKIDISPQKGILSKLLEDRDRLYAYGLVSENRQVQPYLILMGSHYPSGQGAMLNWLYNFAPMQSVGEGHDLSHIEKWLKKNPRAKITGHSKGGTMAMILATKYPNEVAEANCLNPAPLSPYTVNRLKSNLEKIADGPKPTVNVYVQVNDPVFLLGKDFIYGSVIYSIGKKNTEYSYLEAHAHYFTGNKSAVINVVNENDLKSISSLREFFSYMKEASNWAIFPTLYGRLLYSLTARKVEKFYHQHRKAIDAGIFVGTFVTCCVLAATVLFPPLTLPLLTTFGPVLGYGIIAGGSYLASKIATTVLPKLTKVVAECFSSFLLLTTTAVGGIASCFAGASAYVAKLFARKFGHTPNRPQERMVEQLISEPFGTHTELTKVFKKNPVNNNKKNEKTNEIELKETHSPQRVSEATFLAEIEPDVFKNLEDSVTSSKRFR